MTEMKKNSLLLLSFLSLYLPAKAQQDTILSRIILIGDGGKLTKGKHPVVDAVKKTIPLDKKTTILFLGDNLYKSGLPDDQSAEYNQAKTILDSQLSIADNTPAIVYMIPGNHDWDNAGRDGYAAIVRQQLYVDNWRNNNVNFYPKDGCPGPEEISLGTDITLILFDSQWWMHRFDKPEIESDCPYNTKEEVLARFEEIVARNVNKLVIVACHHPLKSHSVHGGYFTLKQHIFPLTDIKKSLYIPMPVFGSIYPIARSVFGTHQDLQHPEYANMIRQVEEAVKSHPNIVFVAGHDHGLQLIKDTSHSYIVSGSGAKTNRVSKGKNSLYASGENGFSVLEVSVNKNVSASFYTVSDSVKNTFNASLLNFSTAPVPVTETSPVVSIPPVDYKDVVSIAASSRYPPVSGLKKFILGKNYREEWSAPVTMNVFRISKEKGGMIIKSMGGGKQTQTLRLLDKQGNEWLLRTVDKNPTGILPKNIQGTLAQELVQDYVSAAHPYAALTVPTLAKAIDVMVPHPQLFFVPDDPALGFYRSLFSNRVCMLEERDPETDGSDTKSTEKVFEKLIEKNDNHVAQPSVLKARLLDILIGDFDRHFGQWRWMVKDAGKGRIYYPIARDRDQAFFNSDGLLMKIANQNILPFLKGFRSNIPSVHWLGYGARNFDRFFLNDLDANEWNKTITGLRQALSDSVLRSAVKNLPPEIYAINGATIVNKLISRRDLLQKEGLKYYRFISRKVNIIGSNQKEYFKISNSPEGLQVSVYGRSDGNDTGLVMYNRVFDPSVTREIRLFGLNDNDYFEINENTNSKIKIRIIGGKGNDTFNIRGNVRNILYDMKAEGNHITAASHSKNRFSKDPPVYSNHLLGFHYNKWRYPRIAFGVNSDDGMVLGTGIWIRTYNFRKEPYATDQQFNIKYSPTREAIRLTYSGEFNQIMKKTDLIIRSDASIPTLSNFFGYGNNTKTDPSLSYAYYRSRSRIFEQEALFKYRVVDILHLMAGPYYYQYHNRYEDNAQRILGKPFQPGLDSVRIYNKKSYLGGKFVIKIDTRNNETFPTRGVFWNTELIAVKGLNNNSNNLTKLNSDMSVYASFRDPANLVMILGLGGSHIYSKNFEFFQAATIGAENSLHGFRKNRYSGNASAYGNLELRIKLFELRSYLLPGPFGITTFYDMGRVWLKGESSHRWHSAFGGGIYFNPFNILYLSATAGFSGKEKIYNFTLGSRINLNY